MGTIRVERNRGYTTMSNYHLRDKTLSLRAIGLLSKMLSLPEDWDYTVSGLAAICKEGRDAIRAALVELEDAGYMVRQQTHSDAGTFAKNDYTIFEQPVSPLPGFPSTVEPSTAEPSAGNPTQLSKDLSKDLSNNTPIAPKGAGARRSKAPKERPDWKPERFDRLWRYYPSGKAKQRAIEAWDKLRLSDEDIAAMGRALKDQMSSDLWQRGIGIPYLSAYLNGRRWEDEDRPLPEAAPPPAPRKEPELWT